VVCFAPPDLRNPDRIPVPATFGELPIRAGATMVLMVIRTGSWTVSLNA
jgi:hypothetical protein